MNKRLLITSIIAFVVIVAIAVTAVLVTMNQAPLVNDPVNNDNDVLLSVSGPDSTVDYGTANNVEYDVLGNSAVTLANISGKVLVTDYDGNAVPVSFVDKGDGVFTIKAPNGGYIPGAAYSIALSSDLSFVDEAKANSSSWDFIIAKGAKQEVVYQDNVVTLAPNSFTIVSDTLITSIADFAVGTILIVPVAAGFEAYKVESSVSNAGGYALTVSVPSDTDVFKSIDISGKFTLNDGTLVFNEEVLLSQLQNSQLVLGLGFLPKISFPRAEINTAEGLVYLDILFVFSDFIPDVESSLSILVSNVIAIEPFVNYQTVPFSFNIGADMAIETTTTFSINIGQTFEGDYDAEELIAKLASLTNQTLSENFYRVFSWTYPIGTTGLFLSYDLDLVVRVSFSGTLSATTVNYSTYKLGVYYINKDLKAICDKKSSSFKLESIEIFGNLEAKAGVLNTLSLSFLQIAKISIKLEAGLYADLYGAVVINLDNVTGSQGGYYLDAGLYYDLSIEAGIEILGFGTSKEIPLAGDKFSLFESGSRTLVIDYAVDEADGAIDAILVSSKNTLLPAMTIKQYDLVTRQYSFVKVGSEKSTFVLANIENFTVENGVLTLLDGSADEFEEVLQVRYKAKKTVDHYITISKNRFFPYITSEAILTFDKAAPADVAFTIDLIDATLNGVSAGTFDSGTLELDWEYLIRRPNGVLEVVFDTSKNAITVWVNVVGAVSLYTVGEGTQANPYLIYTVDQLTELAQGVAAGNLFDNVYFKLEDSIDMRGDVIAPIANFKGVLDGNGKTISNFVVNALGSDSTAGLFAKNSGTIKNLTVNGTVSINGQRTVTAGLIAGINYGTITNCTAQGSVSAECKTNNLNRTFFNVGGIVGINNGTISNVVAENTVKVNSSSYNVLTKTYVAGIAGFNNATVSGCTASMSNITDESVWYNSMYKALYFNS